MRSLTCGLVIWSHLHGGMISGWRKDLPPGWTCYLWMCLFVTWVQRLSPETFFGKIREDWRGWVVLEKVISLQSGTHLMSEWFNPNKSMISSVVTRHRTKTPSREKPLFFHPQLWQFWRLKASFLFFFDSEKSEAKYPEWRVWDSWILSLLYGGSSKGGALEVDQYQNRCSAVIFFPFPFFVFNGRLIKHGDFFPIINIHGNLRWEFLKWWTPWN